MAHTTQITVLGSGDYTADSSVVDSSVVDSNGHPQEFAYQINEEVTELTRFVPTFRADSLFPEVLSHMQRGEWQQAVLMLRTMQAKYPDAKELEYIMNDALFKADLETNWGKKVKGRRSAGLPIRTLLLIVPVLLAAIIAYGAYWQINRTQLANALEAERTALLTEANAAFQAGEYDQAITLFGELLSKTPDDADALQGKSAAEHQKVLFSEYTTAIDTLAAGNVAQALDLLGLLNSKSPGYRDVASLMAQLEDASKVEQIFATAEAAYASEQWATAIQSYEQLRQVDSTYETATVVANLKDAYMRAGTAIVTHQTTDADQLALAQTYFRKILKLETGQPEAKAENSLLGTYIAGNRALEQQSNLEHGISALLPVYRERPDYLDGLLVSQLYEAYLNVGEQAEDEDPRYALTQYGKAAALNIDDRSDALQRLRDLAIALTPTPTPIPTATAVPTAPPPPPSIDSFSGWILFLSNRDGGNSYYIMRPDGSDIQPAPLDTGDKVEELYARQSISSDGNARLFVASRKEPKDTGANIYKFRSDLPEDWKREFLLTELSGTEYDPVWSPNNLRIAFVGTHDRGDEIYTMNDEGKDIKRLTKNTWEWDKYPSWSPDGNQIIFYSNRTGLRQIWIMSADGSNQRALTTEYANWNPIWLK